jgi:hypothetical protein
MSGLDDIRICVDRIHPRDMQRIEESANRSQREADQVRMAILAGKRWDNGRTLKISFLDGLAEVQERVVAFAKMWEGYANLTLDFGSHTEPDIRVSFAQRGSWSYLGTDALGIRSDLATMNYGWLTPEVSDREYERVVLHEFGHALGAIHEHQHPEAGIPWDRDKVYEYYMGPPNNWTRSQVDTNLFRRYEASITQFSEFDPDSIMLYSVPNELTVGDWQVGWNTTLSEVDKAFIREVYPGAEVAPDYPVITVDGDLVEAQIGAHGEEDYFEFTVESAGRYAIETFGGTDVVLNVFGPGSVEQLIAWDDDSGLGLNARVRAELQPGTYYAMVAHYWPSSTGAYQIGVASG